MAQKATVRAGLVGAGFAATFHFDALRRVYGTNVEVVGVHATDRAGGEGFARARGIEFFDTLEPLLDRADVLHVCVPPMFHEPIAVAGLGRGKFVVCEKPLTGYFGGDCPDFRGPHSAAPGHQREALVGERRQDRENGTVPLAGAADGTFHWERADKQTALDSALASVRRMMAAEQAGGGRLLYAENWVYAPAVQKEREILEKTGGQVLWIHGEESHSGSHSVDYAYAARCGGGVLVGKGCHPLTAALYLKRVEGRARHGRPIRPRSVSARTHALTRLPGFRDEGHIRADYYDIEDFSLMHVELDDGTVADVVASDIVLGGIHNWLEVCANNHRAVCNINPNNALMTYNPREENFRDIYVVEKIGTKQGWACTSPEEDWFTGYPQEMEAFYRTVAYGEPLESDIHLAADAIATIYAAYLSASRAGQAVEVATCEWAAVTRQV
jgi:predicted dehydrogenase